MGEEVVPAESEEAVPVEGEEASSGEEASTY